jgi:uncharacterized protein (TIGR00299 family) protein
MKKSNRKAVFDCQTAGISGDMILGALMDLGANIEKIKKNLNIARNNFSNCKKAQIRINDVLRKEIKAKEINFKLDESASHIMGRQLIDSIKATIKELDFSLRAKELALNSIKTLVNSEAKIHNERRSNVHLTEAGSFDTVADIICVTTALEDLGMFKNTTIYSTPVAVGGGLLKFSHGTTSVPLPATLLIAQLKKVPIVGGPVSYELATPTGISILSNLVNSYVQFYPTMTPLKIGYGAGKNDFNEIPNVLRITVGESWSLNMNKFDTEEAIILETNVDDTTGEVMGYLLDRLFEEGAKDVYFTPISMKKNRPGHLISVITDEIKVRHLIEVLFKELGTIGVRTCPLWRYTLPRESITLKIKINNRTESIRIKISKDHSGKIVKIKPEFEDLKLLAKKFDTSLREVTEAVNSELIKRKIGKL